MSSQSIYKVQLIVQSQSHSNFFSFFFSFSSLNLASKVEIASCVTERSELMLTFFRMH